MGSHYRHPLTGHGEGCLCPRCDERAITISVTEYEELQRQVPTRLVALADRLSRLVVADEVKPGQGLPNELWEAALQVREALKEANDQLGQGQEASYETEAGTACARIAKALGVELNKRNPLASSLHGLATVIETLADAKARADVKALDDWRFGWAGRSWRMAPAYDYYGLLSPFGCLLTWDGGSKDFAGSSDDDARAKAAAWASEQAKKPAPPNDGNGDKQGCWQSKP